MNNYDGLFILDIKGKDEGLKEAIEAIEKEIESFGGKINGTQKMDRKRFERMAGDLEREIRGEQERAGIHDPAHYAYPTYAKAAIQRRENLTRSADELRIQLEDAKSLLSEAFEELKKVELLDERDQARERAEESAREQADMDSIGLMRARLGGAIA